jgi:hypothetical protein
LDTIAKKARLGQRQVCRIIEQLKRDGIISIAHGGGRGRHNNYLINLEALTHRTEKTSPETLTSVTETLTSTTGNSDICDMAIRKNHHESPSEPSRKETLGADTAPKRSRRTLPANFAISDRVRKWASEHGYSRLEERFEHFVGYAKASGAHYADWDQALMNAIRDNWAKLDGRRPTDAPKRQASLLASRDAARERIMAGR